ncbi:MAG: hypothetical protein A3H52_02080 [Candidatus Zambryskibacteria bacterium RIFCSPLOWO2_02_FULL_39_26]|uniref:DUF5673 domain-containing protein n=1 Tax=Candidatus Zambryskibacteria bacterium RIFCSPLOWO2_12_FULL_39_23 TaxID=1802776 RepID=A0A1G2URP6_9BACT|nr:MAG: hypothetical protein A2W51_02640 [Candidatus Zambryskibacteria bacterium RIFCSPHIGHO2_02_39_10]OHB09733.1 MAG: hypothetical protein A3H52_02080 [Candidatus Zambryskibacteria bacterium RIFCSPLOWO2_02_FULL_39_26]OHB12048.1 MAG: hypothetical protein A3G99_03040 [Candidatus Zambryskibacteria bacterium RIFCSPLOWO2_12_FULL_39_23]
MENFNGLSKLSWQASEYLYKEKTADWYWIVGIITVSVALIAIILNNVIFAILIIVSSFTLSLFASKKPAIIDIEISNHGVTVGKTHYVYKDLDSFWVETRENYPKILIKSKKVLMPYIIIFIENFSSEEVRDELLKYLPEEEHIEPFLEKLLLYLGF